MLRFSRLIYRESSLQAHATYMAQESKCRLKNCFIPSFINGEPFSCWCGFIRNWNIRTMTAWLFLGNCTVFCLDSPTPYVHMFCPNGRIITNGISLLHNVCPKQKAPLLMFSHESVCWTACTDILASNRKHIYLLLVYCRCTVVTFAFRQKSTACCQGRWVWSIHSSLESGTRYEAGMHPGCDIRSSQPTMNNNNSLIHNCGIFRQACMFLEDTRDTEILQTASNTVIN